MGFSSSRSSTRSEPWRDINWRLELHGRYSHARAYVERVLTAAGLQPWIVPAELRMESGAPVAGLVIRGTKSVRGPLTTS